MAEPLSQPEQPPNEVEAPEAAPAADAAPDAPGEQQLSHDPAPDAEPRTEQDQVRAASPEEGDPETPEADVVPLPRFHIEDHDLHAPRPLSKDFSPALALPDKATTDAEGEGEGEPEQPGYEPELSVDPDAGGLPRSTSVTSEGSFEDVALSSTHSPSPAPPEPPRFVRDDTPPPPPPSHSPPASLQNGPGAHPVARVASPSPGPPSSQSSSSMSRSDTATSSSANGNRRSSVASTTTISAPGSSTLVSGILIVSALESIGASKEAKKSKPLKDAVDRALEVLKHPTPSSSSTAAGTVDPHLIFAPLQLACETKSLPLMITALDCIGKLLSYDFFVDRNPPHVVPDAGANDDGEGPAPPVAEGEQASFADLITTTVCDCFSPSPAATSSNATLHAATTQHDTLLLRLLSCLLSLILSPALSVHQSSLLKSVRTVYNIFLMGRAGMVQTVAQATLGQIVSGVFSRVSVGEAAAAATANGNGHGTSSGKTSLAGSTNGSEGGSRVDLGNVPEDAAANGEAEGEHVQEEEDEDEEEEHDADVEKTPTIGPTVDLPEVQELNGTAGPPAHEAAPPTPTAIGESTEDVTMWVLVSCWDIFQAAWELICCS